MGKLLIRSWMLAMLLCLGAFGDKSSKITAALPGGAPMEMVWIEPGTFTMGAPDSEPGWVDDEGPLHQVTISRGFYRPSGN